MKDALDNKKKLKVIKEAHKDLKSKYQTLQETHKKQQEMLDQTLMKLRKTTESNDELTTENAKLQDNILMLSQKITDELGAQLSPQQNFEAPSLERSKAVSLKDASIVSDLKKTQGQGGGKTKLKAQMQMSEEDLRL